jgi:hypothetical protein
MAAGDYNRTVSRLMAYSAVGTEMTLPIAIGLGLDVWIGIMPVCTVIGVGLGLTAGILHLIRLNKPRQP